MMNTRFAVRFFKCFLLFLLLLLPPATAHAQPQITQFQIRSFAEQCLPLIAAGRYADLVRLYHYPAEMSQAELAVEKQLLMASLAEIAQLFGSFQQSSIPERPLHLHQFEVQSATTDYWAERSRYYQLVYDTTFSEMGAGSLVLRMIVYDHRLQLRSIGYAIPADEPGSALKKANIDKHMTRFFLQLQTQSKD